jgi:GTP-binding protein EngB required for normal cell division
VRVLRRPAKAALPERLDALAAAAEDADGRLPAEVVEKARTVVTRAGHRRRLSGAHTVVALAGATGSGKSSLFNAVTRLDLARVGVRRPTTSEPLACIWGTQGAGPLLDWLSIPRSHQVPKESLLDSGQDDELDGLVLLDLPDHDSTDRSHRKQVDRLVTMVDLFVWVLDPQKYADAALHDRYLKPLSGHSAVTVVVLNQIDKLTPEEVATCVGDLKRLLAKDGFGDVPVIPMSAVTGAGIAEFVDLLQAAAARRRAADDRVAADVADAADALLEATGRGEPAGVTDGDRKQLIDSLAEAAGVEMVATAAGNSYRRRARVATGWPITRWLTRLRPDPFRRLRLTRKAVDSELVQVSLPRPNPVQRARADSAIRTFAADAAGKGPAPWVAAIRAAANASADRLPDTLDRVVTATDLGTERKPRWWLLIGGIQWLLLAVTMVGAAWLLALALADWLRLPDLPDPVSVGGLPLPTLLLIGGALLGLVIGLVTRVAASTGGMRRTVAVRRKLRGAVEQAAEEIVIAPVAAEIERCKAFRTAATVAKG